MKSKVKRNYGIQILRMILSFWVILNHYYKPKNKDLKNIIIEHRFHVPTFIIISFYFLNRNITERNIKKIKERLERLLIPYKVYPILNYLISNFLYIYYGSKDFKIKFTLLLQQFLIGRGIFSVLWFQFNLIVLTIFFYIISFSFKNHYLFLFQILSIFAYICQLSDLNFNFFNKYSTQISTSVGYFIETFPLAVTGISLGSINFINKFKKKRFKTIYFSLSFIFIFFKYDVFQKVKGFGKQGFMYNIGGCFFFFSFSLFPLEYFNKNSQHMNIIN